MGNPRVFFDMTVGGRPAGRIVMELFADTTPLQGDQSSTVWYLIKCFAEEISFLAENFIRQHTGPGFLSMENRGSGSNGSVFLIGMKEDDSLGQESDRITSFTRYGVGTCLLRL
ncbi:hypothetical protein CARUB_v10016325mg [Capsella rubella]|uniref:Uncharacterized protein n=1 Tax=Capsella rubella TaxID=81985 RepID=R0I4T4_9BRAS|nr:hypothetical protein CARUB_v10016325mg [Capsella rubella]